MKLPENIDLTKDKEVAWVGAHGYKKMIRFWFYEILYEDIVKQFDYYLRLDTDSFIHSPILEDPFEFMNFNNKSYAYRLITDEMPFVIEGLMDFVDNYIKSHETLAKTNNLYIPGPDKRKDYGCPQFYNNFEIVDIKRFKTPQMEEFFKAVDDTKRIFTHRWGDAPLRYIQTGKKKSGSSAILYMSIEITEKP
ncbi:nucleotide-diphospho-sugar transferase [Rozella allomycis CSF55]|uniref:Glycosyl transferase, family 15 domain-containing protein n=1 Tax=Rozella allomycis (strain CSF55) TaxID=988480 RepID=A0A075AR15_ROZAC|nr:Glycosyl transferase, family 15 domain-containing protein [Rozella allomycis CSF55]RKP16855.1 nucleotide-diphospho-sugar transferase [Rozella allomycis CSF55]|eukprot:EPZ31145.1 Glycosyl transferase, family 15 domain-containing protein [Rozella allomycis CSF55]